MIPLIKYQNYFHTRSSLSWQPFLLDFSFWFQLCWILPLCPVKDLNLSSLDLTYLSSSLSFASWNFNFLILSDVKFSSTWYFPAWFNVSSYFLCFLFVLLDFNFSSYILFLMLDFNFVSCLILFLRLVWFYLCILKDLISSSS